jgi:hypothetical protein
LVADEVRMYATASIRFPLYDIDLAPVQVDPRRLASQLEPIFRRA